MQTLEHVRETRRPSKCQSRVNETIGFGESKIENRRIGSGEKERQDGKGGTRANNESPPEPGQLSAPLTFHFSSGSSGILTPQP